MSAMAPNAMSGRARLRQLLIVAACALACAAARGADNAEAFTAATGAGGEIAADTQAADAIAQAARYEHAEGVPRDYDRAAALYCTAARAGHADALFALGWMYANGRGMARDDGIAARLIEMASDKGHAHARVILGMLPPQPQAQLPACMQAAAAEADALLTRAPEPDYPRGQVYDLVHKLAPRYELDPMLVLAIIRVESGFNARAVSPKNAQGLMQLIPDTARRFGVRDSFDPEQNIKGGMAYLQWLLTFFKGDVTLVAAAYNAGEGAVQQHRGIPPYVETQSYVKKIAALYRKTSHPYQANLHARTASLGK